MKEGLMLMLVLAITLGSGLSMAQEAQGSGEDSASAEEKGAQDKGPKRLDLSDKEVRKIVDPIVQRIKTYKRDLPALEMEYRREFTRSLGDYPHPYTVKVLRNLLAKPKESYIRAAAAAALGDMKFDAEDVTSALAARVKKERNAPDVVQEIALALGELKGKKAYAELVKLLKHRDDEVYRCAISALGTLGNVQALDELKHQFVQYGPKKTQGVNVRVDTGAAGNKDQLAAERKGRSAMRRARKTNRKNVVGTIKKAIKDLIGQEFEDAVALSKWMDENEKELKKRGYKTK